MQNFKDQFNNINHIFICEQCCKEISHNNILIFGNYRTLEMIMTINCHGKTEIVMMSMTDPNNSILYKDTKVIKMPNKRIILISVFKPIKNNLQNE